MASEEFPDWSDRKIAEACGVNNRFVGIMREELCTVHSSPDSPAPSPTREGADGNNVARHGGHAWPLLLGHSTPVFQPAANPPPEVAKLWPSSFSYLAGDHRKSLSLWYVRQGSNLQPSDPK
jgi:hypothetical protein